MSASLLLCHGQIDFAFLFVRFLTVTYEVNIFLSSQSNENSQHNRCSHTSIVDLETIPYEGDDGKEVVDLTKDISGFIDLTKDDSGIEISKGSSGKLNRKTRKRNHPYTRRHEKALDDPVEILPNLSVNSQSKDSSLNAFGKHITCPICMDNAGHINEEKRHLVSTTCGHVFCNKCLEESLKLELRCPTCRKHVNKKKYHKLFI